MAVGMLIWGFILILSIEVFLNLVFVFCFVNAFS